MHLGEIPDMKSAVSPRAGQDSLVMRGPLDLSVQSLYFSVQQHIVDCRQYCFVSNLTWKISSLCDSKL